jgi:Cu-processing system ATP-binding protein
MIEIVDLHKQYGKLKILKGINLSVTPGKITAILGPNGSGKTTLIKSILGLVKPSSGNIYYRDQSILNEWKYRKEFGYLPQIARFPENLTVMELIHFVEDLRGQGSVYESLISLFELKDTLSKKLRYLSGGTRQKVNLVLTFMFDSPVYILDEPTSGLDPVALIRFKELIVRKRESSRTVLFTTHIMNLVEEISDELIFLLEGRIHFQGSCGDLLCSYGEVTLENAMAQILTRKRYAENIEI